MLKIPINPADHVRGLEDAEITLVEYGDYECPHCGHAHPITKRVLKHFGKRVRLIFRNFPLREVHANAESAAETAEFAGSQGKFWEMHDQLFDNQERLGGELYAEIAGQLGLSPKTLQQSLQDGTYKKRVSDDFRGGVRSGVNGTPTFFIDGARHNGPFEFEDLVEAIEAAMLKAKSA